VDSASDLLLGSSTYSGMNASVSSIRTFEGLVPDVEKIVG
jgi:hypothetical protein